VLEKKHQPANNQIKPNDNMKIKHLLLAVLFCFFVSNIANAQTNVPKPFGPVPTRQQIKWQEMEYYAFVHLSTNTFTDQEWGYGEDDPKIFNPTDLDCRQWVKVCKDAGMKGIIITAKHHSGFCLWPSKYTEYSIKNSPWKNGKGDIVGDLAKACKEYGLKLGIYLSPWDRNSAEYGKPEYITYFRNQLKELLTNYGEIFEVWFDGANGGSGYYGGAKETRTIDRTTYYDWLNTYKLIRELQPNAVIWNDNGDRADLRWVGTEGGSVGERNWSLLNKTGDVPYQMLHYGVENGDSWVPGEVNTSIRPGWFYHNYEDSKVKTLPQLLNTYYSSFGRNGTLLLNFPIDRRGRIHENDEKAAVALAKAVKEAFALDLAKNKKAEASNVRGRNYSADKVLDDNKDTYWATSDGVLNATLTIDFGRLTTFNRFLVQEYIQLGQRVKAFKIEALLEDGSWKELDKQTTIGYKRILVFPTVKATKLRFEVLDAKSNFLISTVGIYLAPQVLTAPAISRNQQGVVAIEAGDKESAVFYTLDGTTPNNESNRYSKPFPADGKLTIQAIAYSVESAKSSLVARQEFDISKKDWKILDVSDSTASRVFDGDPNTSWYQKSREKTLVDLTIDLGKEIDLRGFRYLPGQGRTAGIISKYQFFVSIDNKNWKLADEGEFSNIKNNPLWQNRQVEAIKTRFIRLRSLQTADADDLVGYAELDIKTF
jgi:alpha-L-fucosidase